MKTFKPVHQFASSVASIGENMNCKCRKLKKKKKKVRYAQSLLTIIRINKLMRFLSRNKIVYYNKVKFDFIITMNAGKYNICKLSEEDKIYAKVELNETDANRAECIEEIRQWILRTREINSRTGKEEVYLLFKQYWDRQFAGFQKTHISCSSCESASLTWKRQKRGLKISLSSRQIVQSGSPTGIHSHKTFRKSWIWGMICRHFIFFYIAIIKNFQSVKILSAVPFYH